MEIKLPEKVIDIVKKFEENNFEIYIVGGAVRDMLTGRRVYDWDFTTNATPEQMLKMFPEAYYNNEFGTVGIPNEIEGEKPYEITTFRTEKQYDDRRHPKEVRWGKTLEEDLKRRDFTINAMALKLEQESRRVEESKKQKNKTPTLPSFYSPALPLLYSSTLIDLYGGQKDLEKKLIRCVGDPDERFSEDALRMARAVRIAAELNFKIEKNTLEAIRKNASLIKKIANERIRDELFKILASEHPYEGILLLKESGLMNIILPELEKTFGIDQVSPNRHHIYDVGTHSLMTLKYTALRNTDPITRLASLIHDLGKYHTYKKLENGTITFYNHEIVGAKIANRIADRLRLSNKQKDKLYRLVRYHQFTVDERQTDSAIRRFIREVGVENIKDMIDIRVGDRLGSGAKETSWRLEEFKRRLIEVQKQPFTVRDLKIDGNDVMRILNIKPGPKVGEVLEYLFEKVVSKKIPNEKEALIKEVQKMKEELS
ncbi:MAG: HDIG domain-containing protein [Patescibacteria group bacterium]|nr:MAG: HDIG domain-containing protein [Patescibacteria group bacterium]